MKAYFNYEAVITCGIPKVFLEGTPDDWQRVIDGAQFLRRYELDWWVDQQEVHDVGEEQGSREGLVFVEEEPVENGHPEGV